jgi:hypothetical protein
MLKPYSLRSNWEIVAFYLIEPFIGETKRRFSRQQIMRGLYDIIPLLHLFGHKKNPSHPEETLQKTLQNMRDKKWLIILGGGYTGQYELTEEGYKTLMSVKEA